MAEEKKAMIIKVLNDSPEEKFSITQINEKIKDISYPTLLKWVTVLEAERRIIVEDYGNIKLVHINKEYKDE